MRMQEAAGAVEKLLLRLQGLARCIEQRLSE
jgi:hypothetical protein